MAEQVIIEFVGDTSKLEEAYGKLNEQIAAAGNLNKENAASFQKANAEIASSFEGATDASKKFNEQRRNLGAVVAGGVLKDIISQLKAAENFYSALTRQLTSCNKLLASVSVNT